MAVTDMSNGMDVHALAWSISYAVVPAKVSGVIALTVEQCKEFSRWYPVSGNGDDYEDALIIWWNSRD